MATDRTLLKDESKLSDVCSKFFELYKTVTATKPYLLYRWSQVANDTTALAENVRRRDEEGAQIRLAKMFGRYLEFVGWSLQGITPQERNDIPTHDGMGADVLLRLCMNRYYFLEDPRTRAISESLWKWILLKFPDACGKCGQKPCHCVVEPWLVEERREFPDGYLSRYSKALKAAPEKITEEKRQDPSLASVFDFFRQIYRNTLYNQDTWRITLHLSEEVGEVTQEITRLQMLCMFDRGPDPDILGNELEATLRFMTDKVDEAISRLKGDAAATVKEDWRRRQKIHEDTIAKVQKDPKAWLQAEWSIDADEQHAMRIALKIHFASVVIRKIKEELVDVLSWLTACTYSLVRQGAKTDQERNALYWLKHKYKGTDNNLEIFACAWCKQNPCSNKCLVKNSVSDELVQEIIKL